MKKILFSIFIVFVIGILGMCNCTYAANNTSTRNQSINQIMSSADNFISGADTNGTISQSNMQNTIDLIYNVLLGIGLIVAVVCGIVLGIQFMVSSAEGQAQIKEKLFPYVTGCVIIFGAFGIWKLIMILLGSV